MKKGYLYFLLILILSWLTLVLLVLPIMKKPNDFAEVNYIRKSVEKTGGTGKTVFFEIGKAIFHSMLLMSREILFTNPCS